MIVTNPNTRKKMNSIIDRIGCVFTFIIYYSAIIIGTVESFIDCKYNAIKKRWT